MVFMNEVMKKLILVDLWPHRLLIVPIYIIYNTFTNATVKTTPFTIPEVMILHWG